MSNGSEGRVSRIKRFYGNNDPNSDSWIDVEQILEFWFVTSQGQTEHWTFNWDRFDEAGATKKQISDPNDPSNFIEIPIRRALHYNSSYGQAYNQFFLNDESNRSRVTYSRRIYHHEIRNDYLGGDGQPPSDPNDYLLSLGDQNQGQYLDVEVLDQYWTSQSEGRVLHKKKKRKPPTIKSQKKKWFLAKVDPLLNDPLLPTDVQDPSFVPTINPDDGPIIDPPWRLDPLQNIVNISWGVGAFVAAYQWFESNASSKVVTSKGKKGAWEVTFVTPANSAGFMVSSYPGSGAYAVVGGDEVTGEKGTPVFVLGGLSNAGTPGPGIILASSNGKDWSPTFSIGTAADVYLITWNEGEKAFFAGVSDLVGDPADSTFFDVTLTSVDGRNWSEAGRVLRSRNNTKPAPVEGFCSDRIHDVNGSRVPTSVFGYDPKTDTLIAPYPIQMTFGMAYSEVGLSHGTQLKIIQGADEAGVMSPPGMDRVWAVAFANGIWQAVGEAGSTSIHGVIATSTDGGVTWETTHTESAGSSFTSVAGGSTAATST